MKKIIVFVLCFIFALNFISAIEFTLDKNSEFDKGETLTGKISGNFINSLSVENIKFYRDDHVPKGIDYNIVKMNQEYYLYALLENIESGNYKIVLEDIDYYTLGGKITNEKIEKNFTITNATADFSVNPGFETSSGKDFKLIVQNLQTNQINLEINKEVIENSEQGFLWFDGTTSTSKSEGSINLKAGEIQNLKFVVEEPEKTHIEILKLSSFKTNYEIPIYLIADATQKKEGRIDFSKSEIQASMATNNNKTVLIELKNTGDLDLENISLDLSPQLTPVVSLSPANISELKEDEIQDIFLKIVSTNNVENYEGQLKAKAYDKNSHEKYFAYAIIRLEFIEDFIPLENDSSEDEERENVFKTCEDFGGEICNQSQVCDAKEVNALDGVCCQGNCEIPNSSNTQEIVGWIIIIAVLLFVAWFFLKKYKGTKNNFSFSKFMKKDNIKK